MHSDNSGRLPEMLQIDRERFFGEQVNGDRIAGEGVNHQHIEILMFPSFQFARHGNARVSADYLDARGTILNVAEIRRVSRKLDHPRIDFVEPHRVAHPAICRHRPDSQTNYADPEVRAPPRTLYLLAHLDDRQSYSAVFSVISRWQLSLVLGAELKTVGRPAGHQRVILFRSIAGIFHINGQHAIKISRPGNDFS